MGRPKKITPEMRYDIIYLYNHGLTLKSISRYIFCSRHITLSRTAIKYTIDAYKASRTHVPKIKIITRNIININNIKMVTSGTSTSNTTQSGKSNPIADKNIDNEEKK